MRKAWCVMVATEDYLPGAKIVFETLKTTNTQYPFILLLEEKISFGDKVYVIKTKMTYICGNDNTWYEM